MCIRDRKKGFSEFLEERSPDVLCLQETKCSEELMREFSFPGYRLYSFSAERAGYSGVAVLTREPPLSVERGLGLPEFDAEGRTLTLEFPELYVITTYSPNAQNGLARIDYRVRYDEALCAFAEEHGRRKPVVICGDFNVARRPIDLKNPKNNENSAGYSPQERESFERFFRAGFLDSFREPVSYTHLDVYKRQVVYTVAAAAGQKKVGDKVRAVRSERRLEVIFGGELE